MIIPGYVTEHSLDNNDSFPIREQYRLLYNLPDGRFVAPEVKRRMFNNSEKASEALRHMRRFLPMTSGPNALSPHLYDALSLIDEERWDKARDKARAELRSRGAFLPCDYMFGDRRRMAESFDSNETIWLADVNTRRLSDAPEWLAEDGLLFIVEQDRIGKKSQGAIIWQILIDFGKAIRRMVAKIFAY